MAVLCLLVILVSVLFGTPKVQGEDKPRKLCRNACERAPHNYHGARPVTCRSVVVHLILRLHCRIRARHGFGTIIRHRAGTRLHRTAISQKRSGGVLALENSVSCRVRREARSGP